MKEFHISDILSISTGRLVSTRLIGGVYDILNYLTGDNLYTHALPWAEQAMRPVLLAQLPWLAEITTERLDNLLDKAECDYERESACATYVKELAAKFGESFELVPATEWDRKDPVTELAEMLDRNAGAA